MNTHNCKFICMPLIFLIVSNYGSNLSLSIAIAAELERKPDALNLAPSDDFPLIKGTYWIYQSTVKTMTSDDKITKTDFKWKTEILIVHRRFHVTIAVVKGLLPYGGYFDPEEENQSEYLIVKVGSANYYLIDDEEKIKEILERLEDKDNDLYGILDGAEELFEFPLVDGKIFGELDQITRQDKFYCWVITKTQLKLKNIKGISPIQQLTQYSLTYRTLPDHVVIDIVPRIGIVHYTYAHHPAPPAVDVKLVEYHKG